eukprot:scaffold33273_cov62-Phaeocystis_antarctica.AAC.10
MPRSLAAEVVDEMKVDTVDVESRVASTRPSPNCSSSPDGFCQVLCRWSPTTRSRFGHPVSGPMWQ